MSPPLKRAREDDEDASPSHPSSPPSHPTITTVDEEHGTTTTNQGTRKRQRFQFHKERDRGSFEPSSTTTTTTTRAVLLLLPMAPTLAAFLAPGGTSRYRPRPEWIQPAAAAAATPCSTTTTTTTTTVYRSTLPNAYFPDMYGGEEESSFLRLLQNRQGQGNNNERMGGDNDNNDSTTNRTFSRQRPETLAAFAFPTAKPPTAPPPTTTTTTTTEPALLTAIRENATEAALVLLQAGAAATDCDTKKGVPALVLAAQKGNTAVVQALLEKQQHGATISAAAVVASNGSTALLQAAHFGHRRICQLLLQHDAAYRDKNNNNNTTTTTGQQQQPQPLYELANLNLTTPLMRAAQEGHHGIVQDLITAGANVNRVNRCHMSALMLASQRGHDAVCAQLIAAGASVDASTHHQNSTSLLLACKRCHVAVVELLVRAGCEIHGKDARGRTAAHVVRRRQELLLARNQQQHHHHQHHNAAAAAAATTTTHEASTAETLARLKAMLALLDSSVQRHLMQCEGRKLRGYQIIKHWHLLQQRRAVIAQPLLGVLDQKEAPIALQDVPELLANHNNNNNNNNTDVNNPTIACRLPYPLGLVSTQALLRTMLLPAPLVQCIATFLPLPHLWERSIGMLTRRATIHPDQAVCGALDLLDEILQEGRFVEACHAAWVPAPRYFATWQDWKAFGRKWGQVRGDDDASSTATTTRRERPNVTMANVPHPVKPDRPTLVEHRRAAGFLSLLEQHSSLRRVLQGPSYNMPAGLVHQLARTADLASLVRRMGPSGGIHFDSTVAMDLVMLVSRLCAWYWRHSENMPNPTVFQFPTTTTTTRVERHDG